MMNQETNVDKMKKTLENGIRDYKLFIDTCSLLFESADAFWSNIIPILEKTKSNIIVPLRVYEEINKFAKNPDLCATKDSEGLHEHAIKAKETIIKLQKKGVVEVFGDKTDNFADHVFISVFTNYMLTYNLMLITQDKKLSQDIINIGKSRAVERAKNIRVARIANDGFLKLYYEPKST